MTTEAWELQCGEPAMAAGAGEMTMKLRKQNYGQLEMPREFEGGATLWQQDSRWKRVLFTGWIMDSWAKWFKNRYSVSCHHTQSKVLYQGRYQGICPPKKSLSEWSGGLAGWLTFLLAFPCVRPLSRLSHSSNKVAIGNTGRLGPVMPPSTLGDFARNALANGRDAELHRTVH